MKNRLKPGAQVAIFIGDLLFHGVVFDKDNVEGENKKPADNFPDYSASVARAQLGGTPGDVSGSEPRHAISTRYCV